MSSSRTRTRRLAFPLILSACSLGASQRIVGQQAPGRVPEIEHKAVGCALSGRFPRLEARLHGAEGLREARVFFRAARHPDWHYVVMQPGSGPTERPAEGRTFWGVLPMPEAGLKELTYYIEALGEGAGSNRSEEYSVSVVASPGACPGGTRPAVSLASASVEVFSSTGFPRLPPGFTTGAAAATGAALAREDPPADTGRGLSRKTLVLGGIVAAGGVAVLAVARGDGGGHFEGTATPLETIFRAYGCVYDVTYPQGRATMSIGEGSDLVTIEFPAGTQVPTDTAPGIDIEACGGTTSTGPGFVSLPLTVSGDRIQASGPTPSGNSSYEVQATRDGDRITGTYYWRPNPERFLAESDPTTGNLSLMKTE